MSSKSKRIRKKSSRQWMDRHVNDPYVSRARQEGYRSRAAYKLLELNTAERLIRPGMTVVELGAAPGAWSQVLSSLVLGSNQKAGRVIALDMIEMDAVPGVEFLLGDFHEQVVLEQLEGVLAGARVDLVVSDMAPNLSGVAASDTARMSHLVELALEFACANLTDAGALLVKSFHGSGFSQQVQEFKSAFVQVRERKPAASRSESAETYIIGRQLKARRTPGETDASE
ncbi:MAG: RlmE family RNA methyltransferase [Burkholderiaceae bacterium]